MDVLRARVLGRVVLAGFLILTGWLLLRYAHSVKWGAVADALSALPASTLCLALLLAGTSYAFYCMYDLAARAYTGHTLSTRRVALITFVTYAVSLNLGAVIGGAGFRFNLYTRAGLRKSMIGRIVGFGVGTNLLGQATLLGVLLLSARLHLPLSPAVAHWPPVAGAALLALVALYVVGCVRWHDRRWEWRGHVFVLPKAKLALLQIALAACNWLVIGSIPWVLLGHDVPYPQVLGALLLAGMASAAVHVPAGLGVMEAVSVTLLQPYASETRVLAALIAYRAVYYLLPLGLAAIAYFGLHLGDRRRRPRPEAG